MVFQVFYIHFPKFSLSLFSVGVNGKFTSVDGYSVDSDEAIAVPQTCLERLAVLVHTAQDARVLACNGVGKSSIEYRQYRVGCSMNDM